MEGQASVLQGKLSLAQSQFQNPEAQLRGLGLTLAGTPSTDSGRHFAHGLCSEEADSTIHFSNFTAKCPSLRRVQGVH